MNKEKKLIIFILSAFTLFLLLIIGMLANSYFTGKKLGLGVGTEIGAGEKISPKNQQAASSGAKQTQDPLVKKEIKELIEKEFEKQRTSETTDIGAIYKSVDECNKQFEQDADKDVCITLLAEYKKDSNFCSKTSEIGRLNCQDRVWAAKAVAEKNITFCVDVKGDSIRMTCVLRTVDVAGLSAEDCEGLPEDEAKTCVSRALVLEASNAAGCDKISDAAIKQSCRDNYYAYER